MWQSFTLFHILHTFIIFCLFLHSHENVPCQKVLPVFHFVGPDVWCVVVPPTGRAWPAMTRCVMSTSCTGWLATTPDYFRSLEAALPSSPSNLPTPSTSLPLPPHPPSPLPRALATAPPPLPPPGPPWASQTYHSWRPPPSRPPPASKCQN